MPAVVAQPTDVDNTTQAGSPHNGAFGVRVAEHRHN